jgi:hypothetical protein
MVWLIGAICMILFGAAGVAIGLLLPDQWAYAVLGGILVVVGLFWLVSFRRSGGPLSRNL